MNEYRERIHQAIGKAEEPLRLLQSGKLDRKTALTLIHKLDWQKAAVISLGTAAVASAVVTGSSEPPNCMNSCQSISGRLLKTSRR